MKKLQLPLLILFTALMASCSAASLRCGSDGESTYVELVNVPADLTTQVRDYQQLCNFKRND